MRAYRFLAFLSFGLAGVAGCLKTEAAVSQAEPSAGDRMLAAYFRAETQLLSDACLADIGTLEDWKARRQELRDQLFEMLSLSPLPPRSDLHPVITGKLEESEFTVENLHFQSMPGLYVTANLYLPKRVSSPAPAILYVCGHANVVTNGVSYGNKTAYQHHGEWFARNGYVCLTIDTVQLGEIQGIHHGTYREGMWWWNSRGYTSAGVEAWNCIRALDYLQSRPEVDGDRLGVTGRSGGGAYSWWVAALDDRIKAAAPVAGITDLQNHVVDGTVEGHCDCMFIVNTYRWDYPAVAALVAPRPLLICNSDKDSIFPLDGVVRVHSKVARIYKLYGATNSLGLLITEGPHRDTQDLQLPVFRWFNRHLKGQDPIIDMAATKFFTPAQLKVFDALPSDERTSRIHETFVPLAEVGAPPKTASEWSAKTDRWKSALETRVFGDWPRNVEPVRTNRRDRDEFGARTLDVYEFASQPHVQLTLYAISSARDAKRIRLKVVDADGWLDWLNAQRGWFPDALRPEIECLGSEPGSPRMPTPKADKERIEIVFAPRGIGLSAWSGNERRQAHIRRRFMLLGQTLDGMRVWDIRRAIQAIRSVEGFRNLPIDLEAEGTMAVNALYAALFESGVTGLDLANLPASHQQGPDYLNVLRFLDIPQAVAMAAENHELTVRGPSNETWPYPTAVAINLGWPPTHFRVRGIEVDDPGALQPSLQIPRPKF